MKLVFKLLVLTVMLKVWWGSYSFAAIDYNSGSGILIGGAGYGWLYIRTDDGKIIVERGQAIQKTKWVDVKEEK